MAFGRFDLLGTSFRSQVLQFGDLRPAIHAAPAKGGVSPWAKFEGVAGGGRSFAGIEDRTSHAMIQLWFSWPKKKWCFIPKMGVPTPWVSILNVLSFDVLICFGVSMRIPIQII